MPASPARPDVPSPSFGISIMMRLHPLVAPAVSPPTKSFWKTRKRSAIGTVITIEAAMTAPQSVLNSVENSASPMGSVFTLESVAKHRAKMNSFQVVMKA